MLETLKVAYVDFWPEWDEENFITPILNKHYNVVIDKNNPDVVFHSIFGGQKEISKYNCKKILFLGENHRPHRFNTDYSISFDLNNETNFRLPLWQAYILNRPEYLDSLIDRRKILNNEFKNFASFTVSNGNNFMRNGMYQQLKNYRPVVSYGRYMTTNLGLQKFSEGKYWRDAKDIFFSRNTHKFAITYENSPYPYYCTEKLMDGFLNGSMPIYWGDPKVKEDWNEKAFLNVNDFGTNIIDEIKKMDNSDDLFNERYTQPVFTPLQKDKLINNLGEFETFLINTIKK